MREENFKDVVNVSGDVVLKWIAPSRTHDTDEGAKATPARIGSSAPMQVSCAPLQRTHSAFIQRRRHWPMPHASLYH